MLNRHTTNPQKSPGVAENLSAYGHLYLAQKKYTQAEAYLERSLDIWERVPDLYRPNMAKTLESLAALYRATDRDEEAEALEQRIISIRSKAITE